MRIEDIKAGSPALEDQGVACVDPRLGRVRMRARAHQGLCCRLNVVLAHEDEVGRSTEWDVRVDPVTRAILTSGHPRRGR